MGFSGVIEEFGEDVCRKTSEYKEPIILGFFLLQYAKLKMLELY